MGVDDLDMPRAWTAARVVRLQEDTSSGNGEIGVVLKLEKPDAEAIWCYEQFTQLENKVLTINLKSCQVVPANVWSWCRGADDGNTEGDTGDDAQPRNNARKKEGCGSEEGGKAPERQFTAAGGGNAHVEENTGRSDLLHKGSDSAV